jgi:hypothetical protein
MKEHLIPGGMYCEGQETDEALSSRNIGKYLPDYLATLPRIQKYSLKDFPTDVFVLVPYFSHTCYMHSSRHLPSFVLTNNTR